MQYLYANKQASHILKIEYGLLEPQNNPLSIYWIKEKEEILKLFWSNDSELVMNGTFIDKLKNFSQEEILMKIRQAVENEIMVSDLKFLGVH